jgi:hypothetical protein
MHNKRQQSSLRSRLWVHKTDLLYKLCHASSQLSQKNTCIWSWLRKQWTIGTNCPYLGGGCWDSMSTWRRCDQFVCGGEESAASQTYPSCEQDARWGAQATAILVVPIAQGAVHYSQAAQEASVCQWRRMTWLFFWFFLLYLKVTQHIR